MRIIALPDTVTTLVFDIDMTLYRHEGYYRAQHTLLIERLARHLGRPVDEVSEDVQRIRETYRREHDGASLSLGNTFRRFGVSIQQNARWRDELFQPGDYLEPDPQLQATLKTLAKQYHLGTVTNNTTSVGLRTLDALGVADLFPITIGLDMAGESKPTMVPFRMVAEHFAVPLETLISIGDRLSVDIELPVAQGLGGILVENMNDIYQLPGVLR